MPHIHFASGQTTAISVAPIHSAQNVKVTSCGIDTVVSQRLLAANREDGKALDR
jgi:hypothetical protein